MITKRCRGCDTVKPPDEFHRDKSCADGLNIRCKACVSVYARKWARENPDKVRARWLRKPKPSPATKLKKKERKRLYYKAHPEMNLAQQKAWRLANPDKYRARRARNAEKARKSMARYRAADLEKSRATSRRAAIRQRQIHPERDNAQSATKRARKRTAPGRGITGIQREELLAASLGICAYCNERRNLSMDHVEPISRGGEHDIDNAAAACKTCNSSKHHTPLLIWLAKKAMARSITLESRRAA